MDEDIKNSNYRKKNTIFWLVTIIILAAIVSLIVFLNVKSRQDEQQTYSDLLLAIETENLEEMYQLYQTDAVLDNPLAVENYEKYFLGNSNHNILQKGKLFVNDRITIFSENNLLVSKDGSDQSTIFNNAASFVNVWNQTIYFVEDGTNYCFKYENGKADRFLPENQVGQILIDNGMMYYINLNFGSALYMINLETQEQKKVVDLAVNSFAIVGNRLFAYSKAGEFTVFNKVTGKKMASLENVVSFDIDGFLYLHDGNNLVSSTVNLKNSKTIMQFSGRFISKIGEDFVCEKDKNVFLITPDNTYLLARNQYCISVVHNENSLFVYSVDLGQQSYQRNLCKYEYKNIVDNKNKVN